MLLFGAVLLQLIFLNLSNIEAKHVHIGANATADHHRDDDKIVGGVDATIAELPHQVALYAYGKFYCGGAIVRPNAILTAAHCVHKNENPAHLSIRAGSTFSDKGGQVINVVRICMHPKYNNDNYDYDIAILLLEKNLELGSEVKAIDLQPVNDVVPDGATGVVSGWGRRKSGLNQLQKVEVPKVNFDSCKTTYLGLSRQITRRMTCFGHKTGSMDACQGDSGGPLVIGGKLVGLVSWGVGCAAPEIPRVYTDTSNEEIQEHVYNTCAG